MNRLGQITLLKALVDAEVVQVHERPNEGSSPMESLLQGAPEHTPSAHQDAESALDTHAVGALIEVEVVQVTRGWDNHAWAEGEGCISVEEERVGEVPPHHPLPQPGRCPGC